MLTKKHVVEALTLLRRREELLGMQQHIDEFGSNVDLYTVTEWYRDNKMETTAVTLLLSGLRTTMVAWMTSVNSRLDVLGVDPDRVDDDDAGVQSLVKTLAEV